MKKPTTADSRSISEGSSIPEGGAASESDGFDARLGRLEAIVAELEAGGLGLEGAIERYREGVALLARCRDILGGYRRQVEELTQGAELSLRSQPADPEADAR